MDNKTYNDILTKEDFYPPSDDRVLKSLVEDVKDWDTFAEYAKDNFELYEQEEYYEN